MSEINHRKMFSGFTLAEILITLSIIGVIASMTIPSLVQDVQDAQFKTAWKKSYADLDQVSKRIMLENAGSLKSVFTGADPAAKSTKARDEFAKYLNYIKKCDASSNEGCWHVGNAWQYLNAGKIPEMNFPGLILNNGSFLYFDISSDSCTAIVNEITDRCGYSYIDTNGRKGPNVVGKDIYAIHLLSRSIKPFGTQGDQFYNEPIKNCTKTGSGHACSALYISQ